MIDLSYLFKRYADFRIRRLNRQNVSDIQRRILLEIVKKAQSTEFGKQYHFKDIRTIEDYKDRVLLRTHQEFWRDFWEKPFPNLVNCTWPGKIPYLAMTGGTSTGTAKYIPVSHEMIHSFKKAGLDLFCHHYANNPDSRLHGGKGFMYAGMFPVKEISENVYAGVFTSIFFQKVIPWWSKPWYLTHIRKIVFEDIGIEEKCREIARESLRHDIRSLSAFPSFMMVLFEILKAEKSFRDDFRIVDYYPNLEMIVHGGVSITPYQKRLSEYIEGSRCELRELYSTTEGCIAAADRESGQGLRLNCDCGIFYEFIPIDELNHEQPRCYWIDDVDTETDYAVVLSTCSGLWRYSLWDVVRFVDLDPPRIRVVGRTSNIITLYGEHIYEEDVNNAVSQAVESTGTNVLEFTMGPSYSQQFGRRGKYVFVIEFQNPPSLKEDISNFLDTIEKTLLSRSYYYRTFHYDGLGLDMPELIIAAPGTFTQWLEKRGNPEGKIPHIMSDADQFNAFLEFTQRLKEEQTPK